MTKVNETYECNICGNVVKVVEAWEWELVCCNLPMELV